MTMAVQRLVRAGRSLRLRRTLALAGVAGVATAALAVPTPASAHGVAMVPGSRTFLCYKDLLANSSTQMPQNPACKAAVQSAGTTPLYNWFAVLDSNAGGRGQGYVADGKLCSAGDRSPYNFSPYNAARTDWPVTHLTSGSNIKLEYSNWAHHPGRFEVYITNNGWSPSGALSWGDLTHLQTVTNPPQAGGAGSDGGHYYWDLQLPQRSGQHMLFVQWIRSDSQENFFSCSDVVFDGGNGQVTGLTPGALSADEVQALGADQENTKADPVKGAHGDHGTHSGQTQAVETLDAGDSNLAAASDDSSPVLPAALAGVGAVIFAGGALVYNQRRNGPARQQG
ncbi:lytic polysaccharide monooxygenase [Streptomyces sp. WMMC500]|uniref:lytic polysaccharide monooxygenase auxiliary activity family 9 protein n=1 Tax=Streptomyces sp. WMMC500 TaxID=3015154 RepID=UPI00248ABFF2|nr:lytic polysaccharide monooxygenase [Streptomyces sp. WMMC500]WBB59524.1 lytic polysaccharide monooxygenase [Streptomyces sp. WMMC500]